MMKVASFRIEESVGPESRVRRWQVLGEGMRRYERIRLVLDNPEDRTVNKGYPWICSARLIEQM